MAVEEGATAMLCARVLSGTIARNVPISFRTQENSASGKTADSSLILLARTLCFRNDRFFSNHDNADVYSNKWRTLC